MCKCMTGGCTTSAIMCGRHIDMRLDEIRGERDVFKRKLFEIKNCPHIETCSTEIQDKRCRMCPKVLDDACNGLTIKLDNLQNDVDAAKVSLDKFFDKQYPHNLATQACDVREIYCKLGDENEKLVGVLQTIVKADPSGHSFKGMVSLWNHIQKLAKDKLKVGTDG